MAGSISRRGWLGGGMGAAALAAVLTSRSQAQAQTVFSSSESGAFARRAGAFETSLAGAYAFLNSMMDAYVSGSTVRLVQSYSDQGGLLTTGFTYDNAVAIHAYLVRGRSEDLARAEILGRGLLQAQATNFPVNDGRFAQAYFVSVSNATGAYVTPAAAPFYFYTSAVGDQAWAGMALAQLFARTRDKNFLNGALSVANWIVSNTYDTQGAGGYRFGTNINPANQSVPSTNGKSTEHNIDVYAFFTMLSQLTHGHAQNGATWASLAAHALTFVQAMFETAGGFFYTGTTGDQVTIFKGNIPEDVQTWSYLALLSQVYGVSIEWVTTHLGTLDTPSCPNSALKTLGNVRVEGETFASLSLAANPQSNDPEAVWLEGTAHTVAALLARAQPSDDDSPAMRGDVTRAYWLLENIRLVQQSLGNGQTVNHIPLANGEGVVAASGNLDTGFGYGYFPNLHIGATGWYAIALQAGNPFQLGYLTL